LGRAERAGAFEESLEDKKAAIGLLAGVVRRFSAGEHIHGENVLNALGMGNSGSAPRDPSRPDQAVRNAMPRFVLRELTLQGIIQAPGDIDPEDRDAIDAYFDDPNMNLVNMVDFAVKPKTAGKVVEEINPDDLSEEFLDFMGMADSVGMVRSANGEPYGPKNLWQENEFTARILPERGPATTDLGNVVSGLAKQMTQRGEKRTPGTLMSRPRTPGFMGRLQTGVAKEVAEAWGEDAADEMVDTLVAFGKNPNNLNSFTGSTIARKYASYLLSIYAPQFNITGKAGNETSADRQSSPFLRNDGGAKIRQEIVEALSGGLLKASGLSEEAIEQLVQEEMARAADRGRL
jgi:hypothetical protein